MKILAWDQSTRVSGWSYFEDGQYVNSGIIDLHKITNTDERSRQMGVEICNTISKYNPDVVIIEEVQQQSNVSTVIKLARIQGVAIGFCAAHNITLHILTPARWRSALSYKQGPKVKREELKEQSRQYVKDHFGFSNFSEDRCEAICINEAAHKIFGWNDDDWEI
jgi:Holliday junction resolvasome RuvABC endonuclease subunit